ncbi:hypothetical protein KIW84_021928 [Lathyrus oleraceus]|uniref:Uncharacterized protein n=1 Tax=Pisum sativum TaxID=3888 RepID=A0A9D4YEY7_PEA|nr:hypothetical protein KIW84_021928 [Pisum sativum]
MFDPDLLSSQGMSIHAEVEEFIGDNVWIIPPYWHDLFPEVCLKLSTIKPPFGMLDDHLVGKDSISGDLILKDTYLFKAHASLSLNWANVIWSIDIPPSKSLLVWRLMNTNDHNDDDMLKLRDDSGKAVKLE